jgi:hypothetical protein
MELVQEYVTDRWISYKSWGTSHVVMNVDTLKIIDLWLHTRQPYYENCRIFHSVCQCKYIKTIISYRHAGEFYNHRIRAVVGSTHGKTENCWIVKPNTQDSSVARRMHIALLSQPWYASTLHTCTLTCNWKRYFGKGTKLSVNVLQCAESEYKVVMLQLQADLVKHFLRSNAESKKCLLMVESSGDTKSLQNVNQNTEWRKWKLHCQYHNLCLIQIIPGCKAFEVITCVTSDRCFRRNVVLKSIILTYIFKIITHNGLSEVKSLPLNVRCRLRDTVSALLP